MKSLLVPLFTLCLLLPVSALATTNYYQLTQKELVKLGEAGDTQAIWLLQEPVYYDKKQKKNVVRSPEERLGWLRKGAELGDFRLQATLALHFLPRPMGTGPTTDLAAAGHWLEQVLAQPRRTGGTPDAFYRQSIEQLLTWSRQLQRQPAAEAGDADAMFDLAQAYAPQKAFNTELGNPAQHQHWLAQAADKGHPGAALALAKASRSADERQKWYRLAADGGNAEALATLGYQALAKQNASEARQWFAKAADAGHADAAFHLAGYFKADKDNATAIDWYRKAAAAGHKDAAGELARLTDPTLVRLIAATDQGDGEAAYQLGEYYRQRGDRDRAYKAYSRGMDLGNNDAQYQVALLSTIPATQQHLMKMAAINGHAGAAAWLQRQAGQGAEAARQQQQLVQEAERRAFVARIDRDGTTDKLEVEIYCQYGGQRCNALRGQAHRAEQSRNQQVEAADRQRIQAIHSDGKTAAQRAAEHQAKSECMRRKTESIQRSNTGQQDWRFTGDC
ncbi:MAG: hypothetical protein Q8J78_05510 [Moraxellaceae bacterium]|nr:hypothetical protein [Moraxellaceae bacterium]